MVEVTRGGQKLNGDQIDAYLGRDNKITKIIATGNVYFFSKSLSGSEGLGSLFTWDLVKKCSYTDRQSKCGITKGRLTNIFRKGIF